MTCVISTLKSRPPLELKKPRVWQKSVTGEIADLQLHPAIESGLHLLNSDLESAHFLVRKCEGRKEADYWHAILHRIENDYRNSKAWYKIVDSSLVHQFHGSVEGAHQFLTDCQNVTWKNNSEGHDVDALKKKAFDEMVQFLDMCIDEHGLERMSDVSGYYKKGVNPSLAQDMALGKVTRQGREND